MAPSIRRHPYDGSLAALTKFGPTADSRRGDWADYEGRAWQNTRSVRVRWKSDVEEKISYLVAKESDAGRAALLEWTGGNDRT